MNVLEFTIIDSVRDEDVLFRVRKERPIGEALVAFCRRQGRKFHGYKFKDSNIENFELSAEEIGIVDSSMIIAF